MLKLEAKKLPKYKKIIKKYFIELLGLFLMGLGISLITKSDLGTSPISGVPLVLSYIFPLTFGQFTFIMGVVFIVLQKAILRKGFPNIQYMQVFVGFVLGFSVDVGMFIFSNLDFNIYSEKIIGVILGCILLAWGVYLQVCANVIINSGEGIVKAIAIKTRLEFGTMKIIFDCTYSFLAVILSFIAFGTVRGLREGTVISAVLVGYIVKLTDRILTKLNLAHYLKD